MCSTAARTTASLASPVILLLLACTACSNENAPSLAPSSPSVAPPVQVAAVGPNDAIPGEPVDAFVPDVPLPPTADESPATAWRALAPPATAAGSAEVQFIPGAEGPARPAAADRPAVLPPNAPTNVRGWYTGSPAATATLHLAWDPPVGGGAPDTYIAFFEGREYNLGAVLSAQAVVPIREYFVSVYARNSAGIGTRTSTYVRVGDVPNRPVGVGYNVDGTRIRVYWQGGGGWPASEYVVLFQGQRISMGTSTASAWTSVAPGSYLIGVLAHNALGDSAATTIDVTVAGAAGTYAGAYRQTGTIARYISQYRATCTWSIVYAGNMTVSLRPSPFSGTLRVYGTWSATNGRSTSSSLRCDSGSGRYDSTAALSGSTGGFTSSVDMDIARGSFTGLVSGSIVTGTLRAIYKSNTTYYTDIAARLPGS